MSFISPLNSERTRKFLAQFFLAAIFFALISFFIFNLYQNLKRQGIASGFGFLDAQAGFSIIQTLIEYNEQSTYLRAFLVAILNTLLVSTLGVVFATVLGFTIGIAHLSQNWLLQKSMTIYVETLRNIPLLLQVFFWYFVVIQTLPSPRDSFNVLDLIFLNNRGFYLPSLSLANGIQIPHLQGFNFEGGWVILPELAGLLIALSTYTAAFIAELVRAGIHSVPKGQKEAAKSLGLNNWQCMKLIIIPQARKVIIPPLISQYLSLTKNSSLAAAIGYPEVVAVFTGTVLNQTGQAVEVISLTMLLYLGISLSISILLNWYNKKVVMKGITI